MWLFGGAAKAAEDVVATRMLCLAFVRQAVAHMLTRLAESVVAMVGMAPLAQIIELGEGHRHSLDGHELGIAAANGAVGAPVGFRMGLVGGAATAGLKSPIKQPVFTELSNTARSRAKSGTVVSFNAGFGALTGMAEAAAQDSVYGLSGDWVAGAANIRPPRRSPRPRSGSRTCLGPHPRGAWAQARSCAGQTVLARS